MHSKSAPTELPSLNLAVVLPNPVLTYLKPPNFSEWHPFTISSAPEMPGSFTLHIRGVGQWTNRLYSYFEEEYQRQQGGTDKKHRKMSLPR